MQILLKKLVKKWIWKNKGDQEETFNNKDENFSDNESLANREKQRQRKGNKKQTKKTAQKQNDYELLFNIENEEEIKVPKGI